MVKVLLISNSVYLLQVTISLNQEHPDAEKTRSVLYHFSGGLVEYVLWLNHDKVFVCYLFYVLLRLLH